MASVYKRGNKLWARLKDESGKWSCEATPFRPGQEVEARRYLKRLEARIAAARDVTDAAELTPGTPITVARYAQKWLKDREPLRHASHKDEVCRIVKHMLPRLGHMELTEVRPRHIREFVLGLRQGDLAPRTIYHVYQSMALLFRTAVVEELIDASPCVVARGVLPKKVDKDPAWRATAIYTREEVERLISDSRIPEDRRVLYALKGVAGLRHGEAAGLRWSQYDEKAEPLGALNLAKTKTGVPRRVPVHPTLARVLAEWKLAGWERTYGRMPTPDDFITPTRNMTERTAQETPKQLHEDLDLLGLRRRRGHDLRRTFITLAQVDGARRDLLETVTHGPRGDIVSIYTTFPWPALCEEVAKLKIGLREGVLLDGDFGSFATVLATSQRRARNRWQKVVTPSGLELLEAHSEKTQARRGLALVF
jgi:integrase